MCFVIFFCLLGLFCSADVYCPLCRFRGWYFSQYQELVFGSWVIYNPAGELINLQGICLGPTTNKVAEYNVVLELLTEAVNLGIRALLVNLDSQLVFLQLNGHYSVRNPCILRLYLHIRFLERHFDFITYQHIPRRMNTLTDAVVNSVLDRHLHNL